MTPEDWVDGWAEDRAMERSHEDQLIADLTPTPDDEWTGEMGVWTWEPWDSDEEAERDGGGL